MSNLERITSLDTGYEAGDLSVFPDAIDTTETLFEVRNGAISSLKQGLPYTGKFVVVEDASGFPPQGLLRIGPSANVLAVNNAGTFPKNVPNTPGKSEMIYYSERTSTTFKNIIRGYAGSIRSEWPSGTQVSNAVFAEHHNAIKDAIINIENYVGTKVDPTETSLNKLLHDLEVKYLTPKAIFRAYPKVGRPPLTVRFQNFSNGDVRRSLWDFGDYTTSTERNPSHVYNREGIYTVSLNIVTSTGAQAITTKNNYVVVSNNETVTFFYIELDDPLSPAYSIETATRLGEEPATVNFIDQSLGEIEERIWSFGDGEVASVDDPNIHTIQHIYQSPAVYRPSLMVVYANHEYNKIYSGEIEIT